MNKGIQRWRWFGLKEEDAKRYQREIAVDNMRIIRKESRIIAILGLIFGTVLYAMDRTIVGKSLAIYLGTLAMLLIYVLSTNCLKKNPKTISKPVSWTLMAMFVVCAYAVTIYIGTFGAHQQLAVMCVALFIFLQINFDILPIYDVIITIFAVAAFWISSYLSKSTELVKYDIMNTCLSVTIGNIVAWEKSKIKWENVIAREKIARDRDVDLLTGLWNRRAFEDNVEKILEEHTIDSMGVAMIDIDKFKTINDCYGHETGDAYLCHFARIFEQSIGNNTIIGRRSGDEFFLFVYNFITVDNLVEANERFHKNLREMPITLPDGTKKEIRISMGVVWTEDVSVHWEELLRASDDELYYIKEHGRNNYKIAEYKK